MKKRRSPSQTRSQYHPHKDQRPKRAIVALIERGGKARAFHVGNADKETVAALIQKHVAPDTRLHTDESRLHTGADAHTATHETVKHFGGEYVRGDVHTNSAEGFFGQFKRGMKGVYGHCDEKYLGRYVREFEFRHNNRVKLGYHDKERAAPLSKGQSASVSHCGYLKASKPPRKRRGPADHPLGWNPYEPRLPFDDD